MKLPALAPIAALILATGAVGAQALPHASADTPTATEISVTTTVQHNLVVPLPPLLEPDGLPTCC